MGRLFMLIKKTHRHSAHKLLLPLPALFLCLALQAQSPLFVSPAGNDHNPGTLSKPLKTLNQALSIAGRQQGKDLSIELRGGTYYLGKTIVLDSTFSPRSLTIGAYAGDTVFISAGRRLALHWQPYRNGIYRANVPAGMTFERLYVNGEPQVMARYPNYDSTARVYNGTASDAIAPQRVRKWKNPAGGYVHALHQAEWGSQDYLITGVDDKGVLQLSGGWQNNRPADMHKEFRFVENIFEELDAPAEWWLDRQKHVLYFYPPGNTDLSSAVIEVSRLKNSIEIHGSARSPVRNVSLERLHFVHNERSFMETKEPLLRSDWTLYRGGAVLFEGTESCRVLDCDFSGLGGNAVMISKYNKQDTVSGCNIHDIGASAICFVGDPGAVRSPSFHYEDYIPYAQLDKTPGPLTNNFPQQCAVVNNLVYNIGQIEKQSTGVEIEISSGITVSHNSIFNTPRAGINIGDGCFGGHLLEYNDVFNTVLETGDHGSFNSWGRDRYWAPERPYMDSLAAAHPELILLDAQKQNIIRNNRFRCDHGWDIDLDDGSSNYLISNNVCLNGGLKFREGFYRTAENNILVNNSFHPHAWFKNSGDIFQHNIVMKGYLPYGIEVWSKTIDYNLFTDPEALHRTQLNGTDVHSVAGDPMFMDPASGDYRVKDGSPALALGFKNFAMDEFGARSPRFDQSVRHPEIPVLVYAADSVRHSVIVDFQGAKIKSIEGPNERSAFGLPDEHGVVVVSAGLSGTLHRSGIRNKDVIRTAGDSVVTNVKDLMDIVKASAGKASIPVTLIRNQQVVKTLLLLQ